MYQIDAGEWFNIIGGVVSIIAFMLSVWIWLRAETRERELVGALQTLHEISGSIIWEMQLMAPEDDATRLRQAERALGLNSAMHTLSAKYALTTTASKISELNTLAERGVILTISMIWDIESSPTIKEVWLVTPDLEPDLSDTSTGRLVSRSIRTGKRYIYFYPSNLERAEEIKNRLLANIGVTKSAKFLERVQFVPVDAAQVKVFQRGNSVLYFAGDPIKVPPSAYEEVVLTKIGRRGFYWQQHEASVGQEMANLLQDELKRG